MTLALVPLGVGDVAQASTPRSSTASSTLSVSTYANRTNAIALNGSTVSGQVAVFSTAEGSVRTVRFYLDKAASGTPWSTDLSSPFDFGGTSATGLATLWNVSTLTPGSHVITAVVLFRSGSARTTQARFTVAAPVVPAPVVPSATPTPTPTVAPRAAGTSMPVGDLSGWKQVFTEDFTIDAPLGSFTNANSDSTRLTAPSAYASKWTAYPNNWKDTSKNGTYDAAKTLSVSSGILDVFLHSESGVHYVAAPLPVLPAMTYGRYSVRFQSDSVPGYKTAWLLWPDSEVWPADGEIDFPEGNLDGSDTIQAFMHYASASGGQDAFDTGARYSDWHVATIDWTPGKVVYYLDGNVIGTSTTMVPNRPMHWVLQTESQISGGAPADSASGHVRIDWVTVYTYSG